MAGAAAAPGAAAAAFSPLPSLAAAMSRATTRPCGPEPAIRARSIPASLARRRASGEEKIRAWPLVAAAAGADAADGVGFGAGASDFVGVGAAAFGASDFDASAGFGAGA